MILLEMFYSRNRSGEIRVRFYLAISTMNNYLKKKPCQLCGVTIKLNSIIETLDLSDTLS